MSYRFAVERGDYESLASGSVLRSAPGFPAFPVRLAEELFQRAAAHMPAGPVSLWDPCCGSGYLLTVLGLLHRDRLAETLGTDVQPAAVVLTRRNLELLTFDGLSARADELARRALEHGKPAYGRAAVSARQLARGLADAGGDLPSRALTADVFDAGSLRSVIGQAAGPWLVLTDVPYGKATSWQGATPRERDPIAVMVTNLCRLLPDDAVVAVAAKARKVSLGVPTLDRLRIGTRAAVIVRAEQGRNAT